MLLVYANFNFVRQCAQNQKKVAGNRQQKKSTPGATFCQNTTWRTTVENQIPLQSQHITVTECQWKVIRKKFTCLPFFLFLSGPPSCQLLLLPSEKNRQLSRLLFQSEIKKKKDEQNKEDRQQKKLYTQCQTRPDNKIKVDTTQHTVLMLPVE